MRKLFLALTALLIATGAAAQSVTQSGSVTAGHAVRWVTNGVIGDAGPATAGLLTSLGTTNNGGPAICNNSGPITGPYNRICLGSSGTDGGSISVDNVGGATGGFTLKLNGVTQGLAAVNLPVTIGDFACFADTTGTLNDCGTITTLLPAGVDTNTLTSDSPVVANRTLLTTDCKQTILIGSGSITVTVPSVAGFDTTCNIQITNGSSTRGSPISGLTGVPILWPGQSTTVKIINGVWTAARMPGRWKTPAAVTVNVNPTLGTDTLAVDGLSTGTSAFKSNNFALAVINDQFDFSSLVGIQRTVATILNASGATDPTAIHLAAHSFVGAQGGGAIKIDLNGGALTDTLEVFFGPSIAIRNGTVSSSTGDATKVSDHAKLTFLDGMIFGATPNGAHIAATSSSVIELDNNFSIAGGAQKFIRCSGSQIIPAIITATFTADVAFTDQFVNANYCSAALDQITWTLGGHTVTGTKYAIAGFSLVAGAANLPGTGGADTNLSGDCAVDPTGALTCTKTSGTAFGPFATQTAPCTVAQGCTASTSLSSAFTNSGAVFDLATNGVDFAHMQQIGASRIVANPLGISGNLQNVNIGSTLSFTGSGPATMQTNAGTGDITWSANSFATTLATVNSNVGTFGSATQVPQVTVNAKGLVTAVSNVSIALSPGTVSLTNTHILVGNVSNVAADVVMSGDVTIANTGAATLTTAQPAVHTWALAQTFTVAPVFTDQSGSRTALGLGTMATQNASAVAITGGSITALGTFALRDATAAFDVTIAANSTAATLTAGRILTFDMGNVNHTVHWGTTANGITFPSAASYNVLTDANLVTFAQGGTNANLTASNGGVFYSTASAGAILSGTATARQMFQSGASTTPAWSTTTWPATATINRLLYASAANVISDLATANSSILVTDSGGIPSLSTTLPAHTLGGTVSGGGNQINNVVVGASTPLAGTFTTLTGTAGSLTGLTTFALRDTTAAFDVTITATSTSATLTAGRTITLDVGNVAHTIKLGTTANTITFPSLASYTVITSGDTGTVTNTILANSSTTVNGTTCTLGSSCTATAAAGTLTGATLNSGVTASSLTSLGTITSLTATTINAFTLGGTIAGGGNQINNVVIGTSTPLAGSFTTVSGSTSVTSPLYIGGSGTTGTQLTFKTTTGNGTTDAYAFTGGNNGGTTFGAWNSTGLGVGTTTANVDVLLKLNANTATPPAASNAGAHLVLADGSAGGWQVNSFAANGLNVFRRANTTAASPSGIADADVIGRFVWQGYASTTNDYVQTAIMLVTAVGAFTNTSTGSKVTFSLTPPSTTGVSQRHAFWGSGGFALGSTAVATDPGNGGLLIDGTFKTNATTDATSTSTGAIQNPGGMSVNKRVWMNGLSASSAGLSAACVENTGEITSNTGVTTCLISSERWKNDIRDLVPSEFDARAALLAMQAKLFKYTNPAGDANIAGDQIGFIAEDMYRISPPLAAVGVDGLVRSWRVEPVVALLVQGWQRHDREIAELRADNDNLRVEMERLRHAR